MKILTTILLSLLAIGMTTMAVILAVNGNLASITGWYNFRPGMPLLAKNLQNSIKDASWMRIKDLHDEIECERDAQGNWWIRQPFTDRMDPYAVEAILKFTALSKVVGTIPINTETRKNMGEYGVETSPIHVTIKKDDDEGHATMARYTLGNASPWYADAEDGKSLLPTTYLRTSFYGKDKRVHVVSGNILNIFKNGLEALRDPRPLAFDPATLNQITIENKGAETITLSATCQNNWSIQAPVAASVNADNVEDLLSSLVQLKAVQVQDLTKDIKLPEPELVITLHEASKEHKLTLYPAFASDNRQVCYARVNDRNVLFTLLYEKTAINKGSYASIINAVCKLPVLTEQQLAQVRSKQHVSYIKDLPHTLTSLRSHQFSSSIEPKKVMRVSLRTGRANSSAIVLLRVPGDKDSQVEDKWFCSATSQTKYRPAEEAVVMNFLHAFGSVPVKEIVEDIPIGGDVKAAMQKYNLLTPTYTIMILQKNLMTQEEETHIFYISRAKSPQGRIAWYGIEKDRNSICRLDTKMTQLLSPRLAKWQSRNVFSFPISAVRRVTQNFMKAKVELNYDYIGEDWTGTLNGKDITPDINIHRASNYVRNLQKLKVHQWIDPYDQDALDALQKPVFSVVLDLELVDYDDAEQYSVEHQGEVEITDNPEEMLDGTEAIDEHLRNIAMAKRKVTKHTCTLEIAPALYDSDKPFFYGRIVETGELFIIKFDEAQRLGSSVIEL